MKNEERVKNFMEWFVGWYKPLSSKMDISVSMFHEVSPTNKQGIVWLENFNKKDNSKDAKVYMQEIVNKADEFGITMYLEPIPLYTEEKWKKNKITKEYLVNYYSKFGFTENWNKTAMKRIPKASNFHYTIGGL